MTPYFLPGCLEVEVKLWQSVSRPVRPGVRHTSGIHYQFFFLIEIFFRQLRVCYFVVPSLTRGRICNFTVAAGPRQHSPAGLKTIFYCPNPWDSPNLEGQVPVFISPQTGCSLWMGPIGNTTSHNSSALVCLTLLQWHFVYCTVT
jgi:hypothetical protein